MGTLFDPASMFAPECLLFNLIESLSEAVYFKDLESKFVLINSAAARVFNLESTKDAVGKSDKDIFATEHATAAALDEEEIIRTGKPLLEQIEKETWPDGSETWVRTTKYPLLTADREIIGTFGISRDITATKRAEFAIETAHRAEDAAIRLKQNIISEINAEDKESFTDESCRNEEEARINLIRRFGILKDQSRPDLDEIAFLASKICDTPIALVTIVDRERQWFKGKVGLNLSGTPRESSFCAHALYDAKLLLVPDARLDERFVSNPLVVGDPYIRFYAGAPLVTSTGQTLGTLCIIDVMPRFLNEMQKNALEVLARHAVNAIELGYQRQLQSRLTRETQTANNAKSEFLAIMSHEIRTPLNGVMGMTDILGTTALNEMQQECVDTVKSCGQSLLAVLNDVLDYSKIEAGGMQMEYRSFNLGPCIEEAIDLFAAEVRRKKLKLRYSIAPVINTAFLGDSMRIRQVLINLIGNAVKFSEKGKIEVKVDLVETENDRCQLLFRVSDDGIGIPKSALEKLFHPFQQVDPTITRRFGGTGLGLVISKRLVEMMGGRMWVDSSIGKGSHFYFVIDLKRSISVCDDRDSGCEPQGNQRDAKANLRILVAEDNLINQRVTLLMLSRLGYSAEAVVNGMLAVEATTEREYDLVFMDIQMPEMDGIEAANLMRQRLPCRCPVLFALTAQAVEGDRERILGSGFDGYISKPLNADDLKQALETSIRLLGTREVE